MSRARSTTRDRATGAIAVAVTAGAAAAAAAAAVNHWVGVTAVVAASTGVAAGLAALLAAHRFVIAASRSRVRSADRLVLETQKQLRNERADRAARRELDRALDQSEDEEAVLVVARHALARHFPDRPIELHLVDPIDPLLTVELVLSRSADHMGFRSSPWEPLATRNGVTLTYESTDRLDACPHLRARAGRPRSAVAVPLTATGRILGLIYAFGPDGQVPDAAGVVLLEEFGSAIAARLAVTRTPETSVRRDSIDRLTGLPDRPAMQQRVIRMLGDRLSFTVAVADIDDFGALNRRYGRRVGDEALALLGRVSRRTIRPDDLVGRVGGDELLFVMPDTGPDDATRAIERIREELFVQQSIEPGTPRFTMSVGVVGSVAGHSIDAILKTAATALRSARDAGGNRIVVGEPVTEPT